MVKLTRANSEMCMHDVKLKNMTWNSTFFLKNFCLLYVFIQCCVKGKGNYKKIKNKKRQFSEELSGMGQINNPAHQKEFHECATICRQKNL
jgi:hypothetical protein